MLAFRARPATQALAHARVTPCAEVPNGHYTSNMRRLAAVLFLIAAGSARAQWLALDDAVEQARGARKPLIVYLRGACGGCNRKSDAFVEAADAHEVIVRSYAPFVRARAGAGDSTTSAL